MSLETSGSEDELSAALQKAPQTKSQSMSQSNTPAIGPTQGSGVEAGEASQPPAPVSEGVNLSLIDPGFNATLKAINDKHVRMTFHGTSVLRKQLDRATISNLLTVASTSRETPPAPPAEAPVPSTSAQAASSPMTVLAKPKDTRRSMPSAQEQLMALWDTTVKSPVPPKAATSSKSPHRLREPLRSHDDSGTDAESSDEDQARSRPTGVSERHLRVCSIWAQQSGRTLFPINNPDRSSSGREIYWAWLDGTKPPACVECSCAGLMTINRNKALAAVSKIGHWSEVIHIFEGIHDLVLPNVCEDAESAPTTAENSDDDDDPHFSSYDCCAEPDLSALTGRANPLKRFCPQEHCISVSSVQPTTLRMDGSPKLQNIVTYLTNTVHSAVANNFVDEFSRMRIGTVFTSTKINKASNVTGVMGTEFAGTFPENERLERFDLMWSSSLVTAEGSAAGEDSISSSNMIESRKASERIAQDLVLAPNVAAVLCHDIPQEGLRFNNCAFYTVAFLMAQHMQLAEASADCGPLNMLDVVPGNAIYRNYNDVAPHDTLTLLREDCLTGALIFQADQLVPIDQWIVCCIASGLPRFESAPGQRFVPHQHFHCGPMPVRFYGKVPGALPIRMPFNYHNLLAVIFRVARLREELGDMVSGYIRAALIGNGTVVTVRGADNNIVRRWMTSTFELGRYFLPKPRDTVITWRWLRLTRLIPNPLMEIQSATEWESITRMTDRERWVVGSMIATLYTNFFSHILLMFNIWGPELNQWATKSTTLAAHWLNNFLETGQQENIYRFMPMVCDQISTWTPCSLDVFNIMTSEFGTLANYAMELTGEDLYGSLSYGVPRIGDLPSCAFLMQELPREWGIFSKPVSWDITAEIRVEEAANIRSQGLYLRYGCDDYVPNASKESQYRAKLYVWYGATAINCIMQQAEVLENWPLVFETFAIGTGSMVAPSSISTYPQYQPRYNAALNIVVPGTLRSFAWNERQVLAPVVRYQAMGIQCWTLINKCAKMSDVCDVGWAWVARSNNAPIPSDLPEVQFALNNTALTQYRNFKVIKPGTGDKKGKDDGPPQADNTSVPALPESGN